MSGRQRVEGGLRLLNLYIKGISHGGGKGPREGQANLYNLTRFPTRIAPVRQHSGLARGLRSAELGYWGFQAIRRRQRYLGPRSLA